MKKTKSKGLVVIAVILLLVMCIGYAAITSQLSITGNGSITKATWEIYFANVTVTEGSVATAAPATIDSDDATKLTYTANFANPGDFYGFTVDVKNNGTLPAKISEITADSLSTYEDTLLNYTVTYADGSAIAADDKLAVNATKTLKFRLEFDSAVTAEQINAMEADLSVTLSYKLDFVQDV